MQGHLYVHPYCIIEKLDEGKESIAKFLELIECFLKTIDDKTRTSASSINDLNEYQTSDGESPYEAIFSKTHSSTDAGALMGSLNKVIGKLRDKQLNLNIMNSNLTGDSAEGYYFGLISDSTDMEGIEHFQKVHSDQSLYKFHIEFLKLAPESEESYAERCKDFFTSLYFDQGFQDSLKTLGDGTSTLKGIVHFSKAATDALIVLDKHCFTSPIPTNIFIDLQEKSGFTCTAQGKSKKEKNLKFDVVLPDKSTSKINCEYHLKMPHRNDDETKNYYSRLYFGIYPLGYEFNFYVYHLGKHL